MFQNGGDRYAAKQRGSKTFVVVVVAVVVVVLTLTTLKGMKLCGV